MRTKPQGVDNPQVPAAEPAREGHNRAFERVGDTLLVSYSISEDFSPEFTETYDIAAGGMAILTNAELPSNMQLVVQLELRGDCNPTLRLNAMVRWSRFDNLLRRYRHRGRLCGCRRRHEGQSAALYRHPQPAARHGGLIKQQISPCRHRSWRLVCIERAAA